MDNDKILNDYLDAISDIPLPTKEQTGRFACQVLNSHSWYKHLPPIPPGRRFIFFIDPHVALKPVYEERNKRKVLVGFRDVEKSDLSHHADKLTHVYHKELGYWSYFAPPPSWQRNSRGELSYPKIISRKLEYIPIPDQLIEVGTCYLTSWLSHWQPGLFPSSIFNAEIKASGDEATIRFIEYYDNCIKRSEIWERKIAPEINAKHNELSDKSREIQTEYKGLKKFFRKRKMRKKLRQLWSDWEEQRKPSNYPEILELDKKITNFVELEGRLQREKMMQTINNVYDLVKEVKASH